MSRRTETEQGAAVQAELTGAEDAATLLKGVDATPDSFEALQAKLAAAEAENAKLAAEKEAAQKASLKAEKELAKLAAAKAEDAPAHTMQDKPEGDPNRRVAIKLFKDNDKYKEPLFVQVNDYRASVPRGVVVEVPFFVAEHIREMQEQDASTAVLVQQLTQEYEERIPKLN